MHIFSSRMQAICDTFIRFTSIDIYWPGGCNGAFVLRQSLVGPMGEQGGLQGSWLLGDAG